MALPTAPDTSRRALRAGFERSLLASAGLHATVLGLFAAAGARALIGEQGRSHDAVVQIARPSVASWPEPETPVEEPLEEIEPEPPSPVPEPVPEPTPSETDAAPPASELAPLADSERLWDALAHARLRRPRPAAEPAEAERESEQEPEDAGAPAPAVAQPAPPAEASTATVAEGATRGARPIHAPTPRYPPVSLRLGEEGAVLCRLHVTADGAVERVEVVESSGRARLDGAAAEALRAWRFEPALEGGRAVAEVYWHRVVFRLDDPA